MAFCSASSIVTCFGSLLVIISSQFETLISNSDSIIFNNSFLLGDCDASISLYIILPFSFKTCYCAKIKISFEPCIILSKKRCFYDFVHTETSLFLIAFKFSVDYHYPMIGKLILFNFCIDFCKHFFFKSLDIFKCLFNRNHFLYRLISCCNLNT